MFYSSAAVWRWIGSLRLFCLCVYTFPICWFPLNVFGAHFVVLGATSGLLFEPFGAPRAPKGLSLASLWPPWGCLGTPWGHLGHLGPPRGAWDVFGSKMDVQFRANGSQVARLRAKSDLAELSRVCRVCCVWAQSGAGPAAPNPTSLAPGARMTVV